MIRIRRVVRAHFEPKPAKRRGGKRVKAALLGYTRREKWEGGDEDPSWPLVELPCSSGMSQISKGFRVREKRGWRDQDYPPCRARNLSSGDTGEPGYLVFGNLLEESGHPPDGGRTHLSVGPKNVAWIGFDQALGNEQKHLDFFRSRA